MTTTVGSSEMKRLYERWVRMWNGDIGLANEILGDDFIFHREGGQGNVEGPDSVKQMIEGSRSAFAELLFRTQIGPLVDGQWLVGRNQATGIYKGGIPKATAQPGATIELVGIDMLRVGNGKLVECWHNGNDLAFMMQLGAVQMVR